MPRTWPAVVDIDPVQTVTWRRVEVRDPATNKTTTELLGDNTVFGYLPPVVTAAQGDDPDALGKALSRMYCQAELMPDLPQAVPTATKR